MLVPPFVPPPPAVPPLPAAAPPLLEPLDAAGAELAAGADAALELEALELALDDAVGVTALVVVGVVAVAVVVVVAVVGAAATAEVGMVSGGASVVSAWGVELEPQPATPTAAAAMSATGMSRDAAGLPVRIARIMKLRAAPSGARSADSR